MSNVFRQRPLEKIDHDRRRYFARLAATIAGAGLGVFAIAQVIDRESREFSGLDRATEWLNSSPLTAASLAGKVVLVDFCTYTCINWLRTLPYVRAWSQKYRDQLVVIGVHTPEFPFEQDVNNVRRTVRQLGIEYPVAVDNDTPSGALSAISTGQPFFSSMRGDAFAIITSARGNTSSQSGRCKSCSPKQVPTW